MSALKVRKSDIINGLKPLWLDQINPETDNKYPSFIDLFEDWIIWHIEDPKRSSDIYQAWLKYIAKYNRNNWVYIYQELAVDNFLGKQNRWWFNIDGENFTDNFIIG